MRLALAAALASIVLRLPTTTRLPLTWDGVQYLLGVLHYDLALHQPHPPGYFLYVFGAKALHAAGMSPHAALLAVTMLSGALMAMVLVWWAGRMEGRHAAIAAASLCVFSPLLWAAATDPNTNSVAGMASAGVGWLCWRTWREGGWWGAASGAALALAAGLHPAAALFLLPLWLWCVLQSGPKWALAGLAALLLVGLAWALPFASVVGGWAQFGRASRPMWSALLAQAPVTGHLGQLGVHLGTLLTGAIGALLLGWLFVPSAAGCELMRARLFLALWLTPALAFFLLVHMSDPQYLMSLAPPLLLFGAIGLGRGLGEMSSRWRRAALLALLAAVNANFIWFSVVKPERATQRELQTIVAACQPYATPHTVALTGDTSPTEPLPGGRWLPFRVAMYLMPEVTVCIFPLERPGPLDAVPNAGQNLRSIVLRPPSSFAGITHLLLLGAELRDYLPAGVQAKPLVQTAQASIYVVSLDPDAPLVLGAGGRLTLTPEGGDPSR